MIFTLRLISATHTTTHLAFYHLLLSCSCNHFGRQKTISDYRKKDTENIVHTTPHYLTGINMMLLTCIYTLSSALAIHTSAIYQHSLKSIIIVLLLIMI